MSQSRKRRIQDHDDDDDSASASSAEAPTPVQRRNVNNALKDARKEETRAEAFQRQLREREAREKAAEAKRAAAGNAASAAAATAATEKEAPKELRQSTLTPAPKQKPPAAAPTPASAPAASPEAAESVVRKKRKTGFHMDDLVADVVDSVFPNESNRKRNKILSVIQKAHYFENINLTDAQFVVTAKNDKTMANVKFPGQRTRKFTIMSPAMWVRYPGKKMYPYGERRQDLPDNASEKWKKCVGNQFLGESSVFKYSLSLSSVDGTNEPDTQDLDALKFVRFLDAIRKWAALKIWNCRSHGYGSAVRAAAKAGAKEKRKQENAIRKEAGLEPKPEELTPREEFDHFMKHHVSSPVHLHEQKLPGAAGEEKKYIPVASTEYITAKCRSFRKMWPDELKVYFKSRASENDPLVLKPGAKLPASVRNDKFLEQGFLKGAVRQEVPMYNALDLQKTDKDGNPIPIPMADRRLLHGALVSVMLNIGFYDWAPNKTCGITIAPVSIILFRQGTGGAQDSEVVMQADWKANPFGDDLADVYEAVKEEKEELDRKAVEEEEAAAAAASAAMDEEQDGEQAQGVPMVPDDSFDDGDAPMDEAGLDPFA